MATHVRQTFRVPAALDLAAIDPQGHPIGLIDKAAAAGEMTELRTRLEDLQEALYAEASGAVSRPPGRAVLLVLQGMDTSGKGGVIRHVAGLVNPQGLQIASFKKPTEEERAHHFLWRIRKQVPAPGRIGVFDRSHYEDVLIARVEESVPEAVWRGRYAEINAFESELAGQGVTIIKCMLHISPTEQAKRLLARLDDPGKLWKYSPVDVGSRARWPQYQVAYADALRHCDSDAAPWYVIPSDRKWYRNWAITALLVETLTVMDPQFPPAHVDVDAERARIRASVVG